VTRWQRYWFADGGRTALAIVRIAVALAVLLTLARLDNPVSTGDLAGAHTLYRPIGIWMLLGHHAPPDAVVTLLWIVAWISTAAMLAGAASRASTAVSFVSAVALASLSFAASKAWSHQYNVVFLAQLALLGARCGDTLSVDALVRHLRKLPPIDRARAYQWSLRLVQLAVALMFVGAVFHKLLHGHFTLRWALSDNLRHHLLVKYDLAGLERPPVVDWLLADSLRYRGAALLNMISQAAPLAAVLFPARPLVRAAAGMFFVIETVALGLVVDLWNPHWLPLVAVFIDWDALIGRVTKRGVSYPVAPTPYHPPLAPRIFITCFLVYELLTAFVPTVDQRLNTYPFSAFPMFATIRVRPPYDRHMPYGIAGVWFEVKTTDRPMDLPTQRWFDHTNRSIVTVRDPVDLEKRMRAILAQAQKRYWDYGVKSMRLWLAIYEVPAYPAPPTFERHAIAIMGELADDGTFHSYLGKRHGNPGGAGSTLELPARPGGWDKAQMIYYDDDDPTLHELGAPIVGNTVDVSHVSDGNPLHFVVVVGSTPWLVTSYAPWVRW